jgi:hypothetical protein
MSHDLEFGRVWEKIFAPLGRLKRMRAICSYSGYITSIMWSFKWSGLKELLCGRNLVHVTRNQSLPSLLPPLGPRATYFYSSEKGRTNIGICFVSCEILNVRGNFLAKEPNISLAATPQSGYVLLFRRPTFRSSPHLLGYILSSMYLSITPCVRSKPRTRRNLAQVPPVRNFCFDSFWYWFTQPHPAIMYREPKNFLSSLRYLIGVFTIISVHFKRCTKLFSSSTQYELAI